MASLGGVEGKGAGIVRKAEEFMSVVSHIQILMSGHLYQMLLIDQIQRNL